MHRLRAFLLILVSLLSIGAGAQSTGADAPRPQQKAAYSLTGETLQKAVAVSRFRNVMHFVRAGWEIAVLVLVLRLGIAARVRDRAVRAANSPWVQGLIFVPALIAVLTLASFPLDFVSHIVSLKYGLSVQSWGGWLFDHLKALLVLCAIGYLPAVLLHLRLTRSPQRWWAWYWLGSVPFVILLIFISPIVLDPIMNKFEPLQPEDPALVQKLETVVARGGLDIPPSRMYLMKASSKTTQLNAYVTGLGASKRVVVWDTSLQRATDDQIAYIFGHEMGHYVLQHIPQTTALVCILLLIAYYIAHRFLGWSLAHRSGAWQVGSSADWVALVVIYLAITVTGFLAEPLINAYSRHNEHAADVYGMEAVHGIVANPQQAAQSSFQLLGEASLVDPDTNAFVEFWADSHPSIPDRAEFVRSYDPWRTGQKPKYFPK